MFQAEKDDEYTFRRKRQKGDRKKSKKKKREKKKSKKKSARANTEVQFGCWDSKSKSIYQQLVLVAVVIVAPKTELITRDKKKKEGRKEIPF